MECPFCCTTNIEGSDHCEFCNADLSVALDGDSASHIEADLIRRPLAELAAKDYVVVGPGTTVQDTLKTWRNGGFHCAIVVENDVILGIFTERDVLNKLAHDYERCAGDAISEHMTPAPSTLDADVPVAFALNRMTVGGYRHVPITQNEKLHGVVSVRDMLQYMHDRYLKPSMPDRQY